MPSDIAARAAGKAAARRDPSTADLNAALARMAGQYQAAMPRGMEAAQLVRDAMTCVRQTPKLAVCDQISVLGAFMSCAQLGLRPGVLGQAWVLPYWDKQTQGHRAQLIVGYQGLIELAYRTDRIGSISPRLVYEGDEYRLVYGLHEDLVHVPSPDRQDGDPIAAYCVVRTQGGGTIFEAMSWAQILVHRDRYAPRGKAGHIVGPWATNLAEMGLKTTVKRALRWAPKTVELASALQADGSIRMSLDQDALTELRPVLDDDGPRAITADDGSMVDEATGEVLVPDEAQ